MRFVWPHPRIRLFLLVWAALWAATPVLAQDPADPCSEGPALYRAAKFDEARRALVACLEANGPSIEILMPLTVMSVQESRLEEAVAYGAQAVALAPNDPEARYWYGRALLRSGRQAEAKAQWEAGLQHSVDHMGLLEGLARLALAEDETAKAYQLLSRMQSLGAHEAWLSRLLADIAAGKGLWTQSLAHLRDAMNLGDRIDPADLLAASELSIMAGDKAGAVAYCRRAVTIEPGAASYGGLGEAFFAVEEVDSALVYLRLALEQDPNNSRFRFNLANALEVSGAIEEADLQFREFLNLEPDDSVGRFNYAIHLNKMGRDIEALAEVERAISLDPGMLTARVVRTQILEDLGRWDDALAELEHLREQDPRNQDQFEVWQARLVQGRDEALGNSSAGKVHLQHLVVGTREAADQVAAEMAAGRRFTDLVVRFSAGPAAERGGDIGWLDPREMVSPLQEGILKLGINEISPPIESKGLYHFFRRIP